MDLSATGDPVVMQDDPQVHVGLDLQTGTLVLTQDGTDYAPHHALVEFASPEGHPWTAQEASFAAQGPDGETVAVKVDLLNDACDGPRAGVPEVIWKVVALAATSAGDVGITYTQPTG
ncbi:hypothetical protein [Streptomyces noursei]|uniref:hypothetical protein n=1 Tax=Streptomyces noursei TaxID=1971 RepID=UPI0016762C75|nr:hypothetical protein [Streptomyces noursei]MCZ1021086.1 hypothetical protein [Streptomyces noursei]GGX55468.1 hypothetical protein GCM10010341_90330 [Streptomyces noursei]